MKTNILNPGTDVFIEGVYYDKPEQLLEVYPRDYHCWWGIEMEPDEAARVYRKIDRYGVFFWKDVRYVVVPLDSC